MACGGMVAVAMSSGSLQVCRVSGGRLPDGLSWKEEMAVREQDEEH